MRGSQHLQVTGVKDCVQDLETQFSSTGLNEVFDLDLGSCFTELEQQNSIALEQRKKLWP